MTSQTYHQSEDADVYRRNASFVYSDGYTAPVLRLLDPQPGDRILDLGCGSGELTLKLSTAVGPDGGVIGMDASTDMINKAKILHSSTLAASSMTLSRAMEWHRQDGHDVVASGLRGTFDRVFSNAALHWMKRDPALVLKNVYAYLRPGGRFAAELGGFMNCVGVRSHLHLALRKRGSDPTPLDPWFFPTAAEYTSLLEEAGFRVDTCELVPRLTPLPKESGLKGWLRTFAGPFLNAIEGEKSKEEVVKEVVEAMRADAYDAKSGTWSVMYVRLRVLAFKPE